MEEEEEEEEEEVEEEEVEEEEVEEEEERKKNLKNAHLPRPLQRGRASPEIFRDEDAHLHS